MYRKALLVILIFFQISLAKEIDIYFLDVSEGESTLILTQNKKAVLIDTGNLYTGNNVVKFLKSLNIDHIERLIITHPHLDHLGGVFTVLGNFKVKLKHDNGQSIDIKDDLYRWYSEIFRDKKYSALKKGDSFFIDSIKFKVLSPEKLTKDWNESSLVIMVIYGKTKILLMADANKKTEKKLLSENIDLKADLLKVGHHGAEDVLLEDFLEKISPEYAVISINENNIRGYPSKRVVNMIKNKGIKLYITYKEGNIHFKSDGEKIWKVE